MNAEQIEEVKTKYLKKLHDYVAKPADTWCILDRTCDAIHLDHIKWMLEELPEDLDKANRWLGFIQGVLWANGMYTIDDMREHNRP
jgi:hypothetical protein